MDNKCQCPCDKKVVCQRCGKQLCYPEGHNTKKLIPHFDSPSAGGLECMDCHDKKKLGK